MMRWVAREGALLGPLPRLCGRKGPRAAGRRQRWDSPAAIGMRDSAGTSEAGLFDKSDALLATLGR